MTLSPAHHSCQPPDEAFVWVWLPSQLEPVSAGRVFLRGERIQFEYLEGYLARRDAIALFGPELPLESGVHSPLPGLTIPGCLRDASPDAWGRRAVLHAIRSGTTAATDTAELDEISYLLESGSDRIGALDFQTSPDIYTPREAPEAALEDLLLCLDGVEKRLPLPAALTEVLHYRTAVGGARPKMLVTVEGRKYIAKLPSATDQHDVVRSEFVAMRLAALARLQVAPVRLQQVDGRSVMLVERFDRERTAHGWQRRLQVSVLTLLGLDEMMARYASYEELAGLIQRDFAAPEAMLRELFARLTFNILCGNTDDHARNHAAFWDGQHLRLTPAYDICPQPRSGNEATQAMLIHGQNRFSRLDVCVAAAEQFLLPKDEARRIIDQQIDTLHTHWPAVCDEAGLSSHERDGMWQRQFLNPFSVEGFLG